MTKLDWNDKFIEILNEEKAPPLNTFLFLIQFLYDLSHDISFSSSKDPTPLEASFIEMIIDVRDSLKSNIDKLKILSEQHFKDFETN